MGVPHTFISINGETVFMQTSRRRLIFRPNLINTWTKQKWHTIHGKNIDRENPERFNTRNNGATNIPDEQLTDDESRSEPHAFQATNEGLKNRQNVQRTERKGQWNYLKRVKSN